MRDADKTKEQLLREMEAIRQRLAELEAQEAEWKQAEERIEHLNLTLRAIRNVNQLIVNEKDRDRLLQGVCNNLVESRSCHNAWVALLDESQKLLAYAETGLGKDFSPMLERLRKGELPICSQRAIEQSEVVLTEDPYSMCTECPLSTKYSGRGGLAIRLAYEGNVYGILCAAVPKYMLSDRDGLVLFREVATDIALALHDIELEEARQQARERIEHLNLTLRAIRNINQLIAREKDRHRLLKGVCRNLIATRGYYNTWVALLDESQKLIAYAESGLGENFLPMLEQLKKGKLPICGQRAIRQSAVAVTEDPASTCTDCPLSHKCAAGIRTLAVRLEHGERVYGLWSASIPTAFITDEETTLFKEIADDIAFALHDIELEEERQQAEEALRQSEEKFSKAFRASPDMVIITTLRDGIFIEVNDSFTRIIGYTHEEVIGRSSTELGIWVKAKERARIAQIIKESGGVRNEEVDFRIKSGEIRLFLFSAELINIGDEPCLLSVVTDITDRKQAEEKTREAETMRELNKLQTELLANISHELRTPLASIKGYATMLLDYDRRLKRDEKREYLKTIDNNTDRLVELINQLLDMSRLNTGILAIDKAPATINRLCREAITEAQVRSPTHHIVLELPRRLPRVNIDARRIRQVLDNLTGNAVKYSEAGTKVTVAIRRVGHELLVSVVDQGVGIPEKDLPRVFERMFHAQPRQIPGVGGVGLGLSICKGIVEAHGGRIWIESEEGKGTKCFFTLPLYTRPGDSHDKKT